MRRSAYTFWGQMLLSRLFGITSPMLLPRIQYNADGGIAFFLFLLTPVSFCLFQLLLLLLVSSAAAQRYTVPDPGPAVADVAEAGDAVPEEAGEVEEVVAESAEAAVEDAAAAEATRGGAEGQDAAAEPGENLAAEPESESMPESETESEPESGAESEPESASESKSAPESVPVSPASPAEAPAGSAQEAAPSYPAASLSGVPACASNNSRPWCLEDAEYPAAMIRDAVAYHHYGVLALYQDVVADTENSVQRLTEPQEETYVCGSAVSYAQPLRAVNTDGEWRVVVNGVKVRARSVTGTAIVTKIAILAVVTIVTILTMPTILTILKILTIVTVVTIVNGEVRT